MKNNLLTTTANRRLQLIKTLMIEEEPIFLTNLSKKTDESIRTIKSDLAFFRKEIDNFTIESSANGVQLFFKKNKGFKSCVEKALKNSISYQLLEAIFWDETKSVNEWSEELSVSLSSLYRSISDINNLLNKFDIQLETNPCKLVGNEKYIRYFAYQYFNERYSPIERPTKFLTEKTIDDFLDFFIKISQIPIDLAYYNIFKIVVSVNLVRFKNGHLIDTKNLTTNFEDIIDDLEKFNKFFLAFETNIGVKVNNELILQLFTPYIQETFSLSYERLIEKSKKNQKLKSEVEYLNKFIDELSFKYNIPITNKEEVILGIQNAAYLEFQEPRAGFILYDQHGDFVNQIKKEFPLFYKDIYQGIKTYRMLIQQESFRFENSLNFLISITFSYWTNILPNLRKNHSLVKTLIISNRHISHANLLRDFLLDNFQYDLDVEIYTDYNFQIDNINKKAHDLIITNFPIPDIGLKETVYVQNVPTFNDINKIREAIKSIRNNVTLIE